MPDTKTSALNAATGAGLATGDKIPMASAATTSTLAITAQELMRGIVQTDWAALGNIGGAVTITAPAMGFSRNYGTLTSTTCTVTVSVASNRQIGLKLIQNTGGMTPNFVGVDAW